MKWICFGLIMGLGINLNGLNDKFIGQPPHANTIPETGQLPESIVVSDAPEAWLNDTYNRFDPPQWGIIEWKGGWSIHRRSDDTWYMGNNASLVYYTHPGNGTDMPPKTGWQNGIGAGPPPTLQY